MTAQNLAPYEPWRTSYLSDGRELAGFWVVPEGRGPHPAAVFNHGSDGLRQLVAALRDELRDVLAAVDWVGERGEVDGRRVVMVGSSFGAVLTVLALGESGTLRAGVSFAGPSQTWFRSWRGHVRQQTGCERTQAPAAGL